MFRTLCVFWAAGVLAASAQPAAPEFRLPDTARPERYEAQLSIDPRQPDFAGAIRIELTFTREAPVLWLNATGLAIESAEVEQDGRRVAVKVLPGGEDFVGLVPEAAGFSAGAAVATLRYRGKFEAVATRGLFRQQAEGEWYVLSQFEALSARRAFPCFDEPGFKTPWKLTIDAPAGQVVASNTPLESSAPAADSAWRRHVFAATRPLPSYLVALAVGPFDVVDGGKAGAKGTPLRYLAPNGRGAEMRFAKEATPRLLELSEAYFGIPYPFEKLDSVVIPHLVAFGAMENVGLITYGARFILARPHEETDLFRRRYASLAAHEIAHMWFGNLVTLAWWDDIWLNEAFASWVGDKIAGRFRPEWDTGVYRAQSRAKAINVDRLASTRVIAQPVRTRADMSGAFDSITYDKGREVLSMFEGAFGPDRFRDGVRLFLDRHKWSTATSRDFFAALVQTSGLGESGMEAFTSFVSQPGAPLFDAALRCEGGKAALALSQSRLRPVGSRAEDRRWSVPMCLRARAGGKPTTQCATVGPETKEIPLEGGRCPDWVVGNADGAGHYVMRYEPALAARVTGRFVEMPRAEAITLVNDAGLLWESGLLGAEAALAWIDAGLRHPSPAVKLVAARALDKLRPVELPAPASRARDEVFAKRLLPLATTLGWSDRPSETLEVRELRLVVLPIAARLESAGRLRDRARVEAHRWLDDRAAVGGTVAAAVLETAGRYADDKTYGRLEQAALGATGAQELSNLLRALAAVRDPALRKRAQALALERMNAGDAYTYLQHSFLDDGARGAALEFLRDHFEALVKKLPPNALSRLMRDMTGLCTPKERDTFVAILGETSSRFQGGPFQYRQTLEAIDLCLAREGQEVRATDDTKARARSSS